LNARRLEFLLLFGLVPLAVRAWWPPAALVPLLWLAAAAVALFLRNDPTCAAGRWRLAARDVSPRELGVIALRGLAAAAALAALVRFAFPERWLALPTQRPWLWLAILALYPILSVYPQELVFRVFLFHRHRPALGGEWATVAASALAFGWVHVVFGNWLAVGLSVLGGALLADTYRRTRSLLLVSLEHTLYGQLVFTVGLGEFFYHGRMG
jgi:membrane protease YdiL (CAAX protease family)